VAAYRKAVELRPDSAEAHDNLGGLLVESEGHAAAEPHFRRATELAPNEPKSWCNLGLCIAYRKDVAGAVACFDRAIALAPNLSKAYAGRGLTFERLHRLADAVADYRRAIQLDATAWDARSCLLLDLHYLPDVSREEIFAEHRAFGEALTRAQPLPPAAAYQPPPENRPLRVGFFSPDLRAHSVAYFLEPILRHLDRSRFELFLYHDHATVDWMSERLKSGAAGWRHIAGVPHDTVATLVRADHLDLLFDLAGHTGFNRLHVLGRRLAPVQATYLGYPDTTGLPAMDYRLTDSHADPVGDSDAFNTEQLLRFSPSAWCYSANPKAPEPRLPVREAADSGLTFGCLNNFTKVTDSLLGAWGRIIAAVPNARMLIKNHGLDDSARQDAVRNRCSRLGLDPARLVMLGRSDRMEDHLATYHQIDIALDTFPYHGTTTTCEALWMGVPVITLAGDRHVSRVGCSLLTNVGHPEWIAWDWDEYVAKAASLAADAPQLARLRRGLRDEMQRSVVFAAEAQAARFAEAMIEMVRRGPRQS
jgi:predicted O-linked N-acetylglucosamine transferase (SPINDLY family)